MMWDVIIFLLIGLMISSTINVALYGGILYGKIKGLFYKGDNS